MAKRRDKIANKMKNRTNKNINKYKEEVEPRQEYKDKNDTFRR